MTTFQLDPERGVRLRKRLAVVVDDAQPLRIRLCAIKAVQQSLLEINPLRRERPEALLDRIKRPWELRIYLMGGRGVERRVQRPPQELSDVW
jgi:hypothetical protein